MYRQTDTQTDTKVNKEGTLSGFQEFFLQPIIKDRSNIDLLYWKRMRGNEVFEITPPALFCFQCRTPEFRCSPGRFDPRKIFSTGRGATCLRYHYLKTISYSDTISSSAGSWPSTHLSSFELLFPKKKRLNSFHSFKPFSETINSWCFSLNPQTSHYIHLSAVYPDWTTHANLRQCI